MNENEKKSTESSNFEENTKNQQDSLQACLDWCKEHFNLLKGLGLLVLGVIFIFTTLKAVVSIAMFLSGIFLVYYGLRVLGLTQITDIVDTLVGRIIRR